MATDTTPPVAAYEDPELGVWLMPPSADFEILTGEAAAALSADAAVAMTNNLKCRGYVTVAAADGKSAEQAAEVVRGGFDLSEARVVEDDAVIYCGKTGWRVEAWGKNAAGEPAARRATFLVEGGRLYTVYALGDNTIHTRMRRCLDSVTAAFDLLAD